MRRLNQSSPAVDWSSDLAREFEHLVNYDRFLWLFVLTQQCTITDRERETDWDLLARPSTRSRIVIGSMSKVFISAGCLPAIDEHTKILQFPRDFMIESGRTAFRLLTLMLHQCKRAEAMQQEHMTYEHRLAAFASQSAVVGVEDLAFVKQESMIQQAKIA